MIDSWLWFSLKNVLTHNRHRNHEKRGKRLFKSDRGALSAKDERETLLTTRSSSEKLLFSVVLTSGVVESVIELFIRSLTS